MNASVSSRRKHSATAAVAAAVFMTLVGCGGTGGDRAAAPTTHTTSSSAGTSPAVPSRSGSSPATTGTAAPATDGSAIAGEGLTPDQEAALQQQVDQGHQPWRVDPAGVAQAFAQARFGWSGATATPTDAHTVRVTDPASGATASLELSQPVRRGTGGIWVVVGGTRTG